MVVSNSVQNTLSRQRPDLVKELTEARSAKEMGSELKREYKKAIEKSEMEELKKMPVVQLSSEGIALSKIGYKRTTAEIVRDSERIRMMGAMQNLDGSYAANLDRNMAKAKRLGLTSEREVEKVRSATLDFSTVYAHGTETAKDLHVARENYTMPAQVAVEKGIDWSRYDKWNEVANESIKAEMELEEERTDRDERDREKELEYEEEMSLGRSR